MTGQTIYGSIEFEPSLALSETTKFVTASSFLSSSDLCSDLASFRRSKLCWLSAVKPTLDKTWWILHLCLKCIQQTSTWLKCLCQENTSKYLTFYFQVIRYAPCSKVCSRCFDSDVTKFIRKNTNIYRLNTSLIRFRCDWRVTSHARNYFDKGVCLGGS